MRPEHDRGRPAANQTALNVINSDIHIVTLNTLDPWSRCVLSDAWNEGRRRWWRQRAADFRRAAPIPGDYVGSATREELSARWKWCHEVARACEAKAELVGFDDELEALLNDRGVTG